MWAESGVAVARGVLISNSTGGLPGKGEGEMQSLWRYVWVCGLCGAVVGAIKTWASDFHAYWVALLYLGPLLRMAGGATAGAVIGMIAGYLFGHWRLAR
jgi:hypothetical protein